MRNVVILGSTGSLGTQSIEVLKDMRGALKIFGLAAHQSEDLISAQAGELCVPKENIVLTSRDGDKALLALVCSPQVDIVINVLPGFAGIEPSLLALENGKTLLLGNKESIVAEGKKIMKLAEKTMLVPLDSEHNAIYEIIKSRPSKQVDSITLPCSGGPFLHMPKEVLETITPLEALSHPRWSMGPKVSIESATLLNKGLEVVEAHHLFNLPFKNIHTIAHPECLVHGIVKFQDGKEFVYFSPPDMKEHISNALIRAQDDTPDHSGTIIPLQEALKKKPTFLPIDHEKLPGIQILLDRYRNGTNLKSFLKKEEEVIYSFLNNEIAFLEIFSRLASG